MKEILRLVAVFTLFAGAVCGFAVIAHHAEKESNLIQKCRSCLAENGIEQVEVVCRGSEVILRGNGLSDDEKALVLKVIGSLDGVLNISHGALIVANERPS